MEPQHLYISKESTPPGANECADAESIFQVAKTGISAGVSAAEEAVLVDEAQEESVTTREVENIIRFHPNSFLAETCAMTGIYAGIPRKRLQRIE